MSHTPEPQRPTGTGDTGSTVEIATVAATCRLPDFWPTNPNLWFAQAESEFALKGIRSELSRYHLVIRALSERDIVEVADIVASPPTTSQYQHLKQELLRRFQASATERLSRLLSTEELGDSKPSQLLRRLYALLGEKARTFDEDCLRELFLRRLPSSVRSLLVVSQASSLSDLALLADKLIEESGASITAVHPANTFHDCGDMDSRLRALETSVENLCLQLQTTRDTRRSRSPAPPDRQAADRRRQQSPPPNSRRSMGRGRVPALSPPPTSAYCWYHFNFGASARQCRPPCQWPGNEPARR